MLTTFAAIALYLNIGAIVAICRDFFLKGQSNTEDDIMTTIAWPTVLVVLFIFLMMEAYRMVFKGIKRP